MSKLLGLPGFPGKRAKIFIFLENPELAAELAVAVLEIREAGGWVQGYVAWSIRNRQIHKIC